MKNICLLLVLMAVSGCTLCRQGMINSVGWEAESVGYVQSPEDPFTYIAPYYAYQMAVNNPVYAIMWNIDTSAPFQLSDGQMFALGQFNSKYGIPQGRKAVNVGELCWKKYPFRWPTAVTVDKAGPVVGGVAVTGAAAYGGYELFSGGGSDDKKTTEVNGDNNTIYNNDGDVNNDSHDYSGPAE